MKYYAENPICKTDERAILAEVSWGVLEPYPPPLLSHPHTCQPLPAPSFSWCVSGHLGSAKHPETIDSLKGNTALTFTFDDFLEREVSFLLSIKIMHPCRKS